MSKTSRRLLLAAPLGLAAAGGVGFWYMLDGLQDGSYDPRTVPGFHGEPVEALSIGSKSPELNEIIGVHLLIYDLDDLRGALKPDAKGRTPRGDVAALRRLLEETMNP